MLSSAGSWEAESCRSAMLHVQEAGLFMMRIFFTSYTVNIIPVKVLRFHFPLDPRHIAIQRPQCLHPYPRESAAPDRSNILSEKYAPISNASYLPMSYPSCEARSTYRSRAYESLLACRSQCPTRSYGPRAKWRSTC